MRYAICFTPSMLDPLGLAGASWLGRNVFSGQAMAHPGLKGMSLHEIAFHTALPRRVGFHATFKAPFRLGLGSSEQALLRALGQFVDTMEPVVLPGLVVGRNGDTCALLSSRPCQAVNSLACNILKAFEPFRAPLTEAEIERRNPHSLSAAQFSNLSRWGHPYVMDEFRFHMTLTGTLLERDFVRVEQAVRTHFDPALSGQVVIDHLALFVEDERGAPFRVHSLHPLGRMSGLRSA